MILSRLAALIVLGFGIIVMGLVGREVSPSAVSVGADCKFNICT